MRLGLIDDEAVQSELSRPIERSLSIDVLKGIAILLVVLGHSLSEDVLPGSALTTVINSFHMPLFMMVSGYLAAGRVHRPLSGWIAKKARLLLLPYAAYVLAAYVLRFGFADTSVGIARYLAHSAIVPDPAAWFLYVLFGSFVLLAACTLAEPWLGDWALVLVALLLWGAFRMNASPLLGLAYLHWYWPFFAVGHLYAKHADRLRRFTTAAQWAAPLAFTALLGLTWNVVPAPWFREVFLGGSDAVLVLFGIGLGVSGSVALTLIAPWIARSRARSVLSWLGQRTLEVYVLHEILWGIWLWDLQGQPPSLPASIGGSLVLFGTLLAGALLMSWVLRKVSVAATSAVGVWTR